MPADVNAMLSLYEARRSERQSVFDPVWQSLSNYFLPQLSDINVQKTEGVTGWTDDIFDTTAIEANQTLAAGQRNWLTPSNEKWLAFTAPEALTDADGAAIWYARCTDIALKALADSNFYTVIHEFYLSRGGFGTAVIHAEAGRRNWLNFSQFQVGTYVIGEDDEGFVDTMTREFDLTARQAVMKFGLERVSKNVAKAFEDNNRRSQDRKFKFIHEIRPRYEGERDVRRKDSSNLPYASVYIDLASREITREGGYEEQPFMVSRFLKWGKTPYGYSPAFLALPNVRELNYVMRFMDALVELRANPRVLVPSSLKGDVDMRAGGRTIFDENNPGAMPKEWMTEADFNLGLELVAMKQSAIKKAFFVDLFALLGEAVDKRMTATEVQARMAEKIEQFSPTFDRMTTELLNPLLRRVFGLLYRAGHFPPAPASVMVPTGPQTQAPALPSVEYTSRISLALRALRNRAFTQTLQVVGGIAQTKPDVVDNFDVDKGVRQFSIDQGLNPELLRPEKKVLAMRQERLQQAKAQQAIQTMGQTAQAAKNLGKAPPQMQKQVMEQMGTQE